MKIETLKELIRIENERTFSQDELMNQVFRLLDIFESDYEPIKIVQPSQKDFELLCEKIKLNQNYQNWVDK
jgi:hypothetical protein